MIIQLEILNEDSKRQALELKRMLERARIEELDTVEINRAEHKEGQMDIGAVLGSISVLITAAQQPLTELVKSLSKFIDTFKTTIKMKGENCEEISISSGKLTNENIENIVKVFLEQNRSKTNP